MSGKIVVLCLIVFLFSYCTNKEKPLHTLADFQKQYKDLSYTELMDLETGGQVVKSKIISLDESYFKEEKNICFIDTMTFLPLETKEECLISKINRVIYQDGLFYVFDKDFENLFVFHEDGKYKCKISSKGRGPGEYKNLRAFCVSQKNNVYLLDNNQKKILIYDSDGNFQKEIPLERSYISIACSGDKIFLTKASYHESEIQKKEYRIDCFDLDGNLKNQFFPFQPSKENAPWGASNLGIQVMENGYSIYYPHFGNQVFLFDSSGKVKESYLYQMENHEMPPYLTLAARNKTTFSEAFEKSHAKTKSSITNVIELDNYLCTYMGVGPCITLVIHNKNTNKTDGLASLFVKRETRTDLMGEAAEYVGGMPGDILIGWNDISGFKLFQKIAKEDHIALGEYDQMITTMDESDNPYLVLIKVKTK